MKLLFDQNLSRRLIRELEDVFPQSNHVSLCGMQNASDEEVWRYAREHGYCIVTQDSDFNERSIIHGYPPRVIWLRIGNTSTQSIKQVLVDHHEEIIAFGRNQDLGCLEIF